MSIHFLARKGIETGDSVTTGFGRGFAFATGFPVAQCSTLSKGNGFCRCGYIFCPFRSRFESQKLFRLETEIRP